VCPEPNTLFFKKKGGKELAMSKTVEKPSAEAVPNSALLTKEQAAEYLQCTPRYITRMVSSGRLRAFNPSGKLWRVRRSDLDAFLETGSTIGGGE
jgi:excisionase family DNA binding protein